MGNIFSATLRMRIAAVAVGLSVAAGCMAQASRQYRSYHGDGIDDVLEYTPMAASFLIKAAGVKCRSSWEQRIYKSGASFVLCSGTVYLLKHAVRRTRPDGTDDNSFPSGHTAVAFSGATVLHKEFGKTSPWISVAGYAVATLTAVDRVRRNRHHWDDVAAGAVIGVLSAEASYWLVDKITAKVGKNRRRNGGKPSGDGQAVQLGVAPGGIAMVINL